MIVTFLMVSTSSITMQSLGKIVGAGCRCENIVFVCFFCLSVMLRVGRCVCSRVAYFEEVLCHGLWVDFDTGYKVFGRDCRFRCPREFSFLSIGGATNFAKLWLKIVKVLKSVEKFVRTTSYR